MAVMVRGRGAAPRAIPRVQTIAEIREEIALLETQGTRIAARKSLLAFAHEALRSFDLKPARHHRMLIEKLQAVADGKIRRLMVLMPPGSAKSMYASKIFPAWFLSRRKRLAVIGASHTMDLATKFSNELMDMVRENTLTLQYGLKRENVEAWTTTNGGEYKAAGIGGPITGRRADLAIIDDPVKDRRTAESESDRNTVWDWFTSTLRTRLKPNASVVLIMTRWHMDDLGGRLLDRQGDRWEVLKLPAIAEEDDDLGREPGEWLWGDDNYGYADDLRDALVEAEQNGAMRDWQALYQQEPRPAEGALFKTLALRFVPTMPGGGRTVRGWDLAATSQQGTTNPDWTVGVLLTRAPDGLFTVGDVVRLRGGPAEVRQAIVNTAHRDGIGVIVGLPQDPGQAGKVQVADLTAALAGFPVESSPESGNKATRAAPAAAQMTVGNISLVTAPWNTPFIDELSGFPSGMKDDQVDAFSRAFSMLVGTPGPIRVSDAELEAARRVRRRR